MTLFPHCATFLGSNGCWSRSRKVLDFFPWVVTVEITEKDKEKMVEYREQWLKTSLATDESNWEACQENVKIIYEVSGKGSPSFVRSRSPIEATLARHILWFIWEMREKDSGAPTLKSMAEALNEIHQSDSRTAAQIETIPDGKNFPAYDSTWHNRLRSQIVDAFAERCRKKDKKELREKAWERMHDREEQRKSCTDLVNHCFWGQHEWWLPYYTFPVDHLGVKCEPDDERMLNVWRNLSENGGWWASYSEVCIMMDRPIKQELNEDFVGHCEDGPTVAYGDGFRFYMLEGHRVDEQLVLRPETQTIEQIHAESNMDIRAIRIERFGWPNYLRKCNAKKIDERHNLVENQIEALMVTPNDEKRLVVTCPTGRMFALGVPTGVKTCEEAQNWLSGPAAGANVIART